MTGNNGTPKVKLEAVECFERDFKLRLPFRFGVITVTEGTQAIIRATIDMAHNLGLKVIAEGVETEDHLKFLRAHQCEQLQGFLFSRPLPARNFEKLLSERERLLVAI